MAPVCEFIACARTAYGIQRQPPATQFIFIVFGIAYQSAIRCIVHAFCHRQHWQAGGNDREHFVEKPFDTKAADSADQQVCPLDSVFEFIELKITYSIRKLPFQRDMPAAFPAVFYYFTIQRCSHQSHFMTIVASRKGQCRCHHPGARYGDYAHIHLSLSPHVVFVPYAPGCVL